MVITVYLLCAATSAFCAMLLFGAYRRQRLRLLVLSAWCFVGLTVTNILVLVDKIVFPETDLLAIRLFSQLLALSLLLIGLLWRDE